MEISQLEKPQDQENTDFNIDQRTPWQRLEYERMRVSYRNEFKNLCIKHINFLNRKEALIDFSRLLQVWELHINYREQESLALLSFIQQEFTANIKLVLDHNEQLLSIDTIGNITPEQLLTNLSQTQHIINNLLTNTEDFIDCLAKQIAVIANDLLSAEEKTKILKFCLQEFLQAFPEHTNVYGKDFIDVISEDTPKLELNKTITSEMVAKIRENLLTEAHAIELKIAITQGYLHELAIDKQLQVLRAEHEQLLQYKNILLEINQVLIDNQEALQQNDTAVIISETVAILNKYQQTLINYRDLFIDKNATAIIFKIKNHDFANISLQLVLITEQENAELNFFSYRTFRQQQALFIKNYRNLVQNSNYKEEMINLLNPLRNKKKERQKKASLSYAQTKSPWQNLLQQNFTDTEIKGLALEHQQKYQIEDVNIDFSEFPTDNLLPLPPQAVATKFCLESARQEIIIATAQAVCEALARLAMAASARPKLKTPQEHAGILYIDKQIAEELSSLRNQEDAAVNKLSQTRKEICALGEEINLLIKELEK